MAEEQKEKKEKKDEAPKPEGEEAGSKKKLIIFGGIGALLLVLAIGGTYVMLSKPKAADVAAEHKAGTAKDDGGHAKPEGDGQGKTAEGNKKPEGENAGKPTARGNYGESFVLKPFHMNLGNPLENRYLRLELSIEYRGGDAQKTELENRTSQLRDIVVNISTRKTMEFLLGPDGKDQLRYEIFTRLNQVLDKKIEAVYITDILVE